MVKEIHKNERNTYGVHRKRFWFFSWGMGLLTFLSFFFMMFCIFQKFQGLPSWSSG